MVYKLRHLCIGTSMAFAALAATPATAQGAGSASAAAIIARACTGRAGGEVTVLRMGEALLIESGGIPSEFVADVTTAAPDLQAGPVPPASAVYEKALVRRLGEIERSGGSHPSDADRKIIRAIDRVKSHLRQAAGEVNPPLNVEGQRPTAANWLFQLDQPTWRLRCKAGGPEPTQIGQMENYDPPPSFSIREKPEELALIGEDRRTAGALGLSLERVRTKEEDGSRKTATDFSINGTIGLRLSPATSQATTSYLYGRYQLQQARTKPAQLAPGALQSDDDTDVLETGVTLHTELAGNESVFKLFLDAQAAAVFDFANDSRRLKLRALFLPVLDLPLGLCDLERYKTIIPSLGLKTRCRLQADIEAAKILKRGKSPLADFDTFLAAGGKAEFEAFLPAADGVDLLGSVTYRLLPVLHGQPDEIERFEATLKYRFWTPAKFGVDVGFTYTKGTNELSFEEEDVLTFGLGIIF